MDQKSTKLIMNFFQDNVQMKPNFIFPCTTFDPAVRDENNLPTPLRSEVKPQYDMPGAYVFFEPCNQDNKIEIMWVGRSYLLRNRITGHWGNYYKGFVRNIVEEWGGYCWENNFPFCPYVAIFISYGNLRDLEHWLMQLKPRFNVH